MSLQRTLMRRQRKRLPEGHARVLRVLVRQFIREQRIAERAGMTEAEAVRDAMRALDRGELVIEIEHVGADDRFRFTIHPNYERMPWLLQDQ